MKHARGAEDFIQNCSQNLKGRHHLEDVGIDGRINVKMLGFEVLTQ
jgi:hypothetical protein